MLLKPVGRGGGGYWGFLCFSTLYRVDAIEARTWRLRNPRGSGVSVPSIGSMLLKRPRTRLIVSNMLFQYPLSGRCY